MKSEKNILAVFGLILMGVIAYPIYIFFFWNPLDFGPCDGEGKPDRYNKSYYKNGQLWLECQLKGCVCEGLMRTYYESGELQSLEQRVGGINHGHLDFYYPNGSIYREEEYENGELIESKIYSLDSTTQYHFSKPDKTLSRTNSINTVEAEFTDSIFLEIFPTPALLHGEKFDFKRKQGFLFNQSRSRN